MNTFKKQIKMKQIIIIFVLLFAFEAQAQFRQKSHLPTPKGFFNQDRTSQEKRVGEVLEFASIIGFGLAGYGLGYSQGIKDIDPGYSERGNAYGGLAVGAGVASSFSLSVGIYLQGKPKLKHLLSVGCGAGFFLIGQEIGRTAAENLN